MQITRRLGIIKEGILHFDARYNPGKVKIGYEISFNLYFYKPQPLRSLEDIRADLLAVEQEVAGLLEEILGEITS